MTIEEARELWALRRPWYEERDQGLVDFLFSELIALRATLAESEAQRADALIELQKRAALDAENA